ncbi:hypothetical protein GGQ74_000764 [Desulfobaculum xiamenense]|uniref:Uncharacterized protein n=1 Tax=Desulfobaculum xiamenense TaxID=995050 RepID=A0A846QPH9_9BACT|nr:hypothetical protein [Desulfobaculum xiamenense]NJB67124.1 hypothetical protein [Desulfobaculum xiamenense]
MEENVKLTAEHMHEALDRAYVINTMYDQILMQHPAVMGTPKLKEKAEAIAEALASFYQLCGKVSFDFHEAAEAREKDDR